MPVGYVDVELDNPDERQHRRKLAERQADISRGRTNNVLTVTLAANADSTTVTDARIAYCSALLFSPTTASAAAEIGAGTLYVSETGRVNGSVVISHANNAQTDRTFKMVVVG
jgi:hypothetical protein